MSRRLPQFLVIGAQKAGTSWLHARLRAHPGIFLPEDKDFEHFSFPGDHTEAEYRQRFADAPATALVGDVCASYFWTTGHSTAYAGFARNLPASIEAALGPECRYLVLLRDPVERTISAYLHHIAHGSLAAETSLLDAPATLGLVDLSRYGMHLDRWLAVVPPERMLILPSPGASSPGRLLDQAVSFLNCRSGDTAETHAAATHQVVFAGLKRLRNQRGIWVPVDQPGVPGAADATTELEGRRCTLLVDAATIDAVTELLRPDTRRLAERLRAIDRVDPAFESWNTWPDRR